MSCLGVRGVGEEDREMWKVMIANPEFEDSLHDQECGVVMEEDVETLNVMFKALGWKESYRGWYTDVQEVYLRKVMEE